MDRLLLILDFGGTKLTAATIVAGESEWRKRRRVFSPPDADAAYDIAMMGEMGHDLLDGQRPAAVGVSFGGPVVFETGVVRLSHHVPGWEQVDLLRLLQREFEAPAVVDNDANAAALGEHRFGAGRGVSHLLYVTVSTGVGGGWILNGRPWRGAGSMAGEIGHTVVDVNGPPCLCGNRGCVERLASGPYMAQDAAEWVAADPRAGRILLELAEGEPQRITGKLLGEASAIGDAVARAVLERGASALGVGIGNAANLVNPELVVVGGGVTGAGDVWWERLRESVESTTMPEVDVEVRPAALGDDAPLWGALALAQDALDG